MKIVAIDLGKVNSVACAFQSETGTHEFESVGTSPALLEKLLERRCPDRLVIEVGPSAGWITDLAERLGIELQVANPSHEGWRWRRVKKKTDRVDAHKLAQLSAVNQLPLVSVPPKTVREWRGLIHYRQSLVARRTAIKNTIRSILHRQAITMPAGKKGWSQAQRKRLEGLAGSSTDLSRFWEGLKTQDWWRGQLAEELRQLREVECAISSVEKRLDAHAANNQYVKRLRSVPGIGPRLSETVVAVIDDPHRFRSGKEVAAYAGLVPRVFQSGSVDRKGRITGAGNRCLRSILIEVSWLGLRRNPWMKEVFDRVCRGSKTRRKIAIVAVARRVLIWCWAMMRDDRDWDPRTIPLAA
ncbi:MAG: IS110 family transposase [Phycisphaerales bacterium]|nr:MAG: IS110 family transposase [Phycisphaerales bacterium]